MAVVKYPHLQSELFASLNTVQFFMFLPFPFPVHTQNTFNLSFWLSVVVDNLYGRYFNIYIYIYIKYNVHI